MARKRRPTPSRRWEVMTRRAGMTGWDYSSGIRPPDEVWGNDLYTCCVRFARDKGKRLGRNDLLWMSIHRRDRKAIRDWRHFQAIKNDVAGPDRVAFEMYPAEDKLVDTSNEYHLWVTPAGTEFNFGFDDTLVMTPEEVEAANEEQRSKGVEARAVQREWEPGLTTGPANREETS